MFQMRIMLEEELQMDLSKHKKFIDKQMMTIMGQLDNPSQIFDHLYLVSALLLFEKSSIIDIVDVNHIWNAKKIFPSYKQFRKSENQTRLKPCLNQYFVGIQVDVKKMALLIYLWNKFSLCCIILHNECLRMGE